jgi:methyl-accepting chemotaxis protein
MSMLFRTASIVGKLWTAVALGALLLFALCGVAVWHSLDLQREVGRLGVIQAEKQRLAERLTGLLTANIARITSVATSNDARLETYFRDVIPSANAEIGEIVAHLSKLPMQPAERTQFKQIAEYTSDLSNAYSRLVQAQTSSDAIGMADMASNTFRPIGEDTIDLLNKFNQLQRRLVTDQIAEIQTRQNRTFLISGTALGLVMLLAAIGTVRLIRQIQIPLNEAVSLAQAVANSDLTVEVRAQGNDELGTLMRSLGAMTHSLSSVVTKVRASSEEVATASREIAGGIQDLSQRTEQQAANLQKTSTELHHLTAAVSDGAQAVRDASAQAASATQLADGGGELVAQLAKAMDNIDESSRKVSGIVGVIDGIAFQTNLLALNAAVEAARVGTEGRGFNVVANEVRALAQRSAEAAREIKSLMAVSTECTEHGSKLAARASGSMEEIVGAVSQLSKAMMHISASSEQQARGLDRVNGTIRELDNLTQQNAAMVEQSAAASAMLYSNSEEMARSVQVFRVSADTPCLQASSPIEDECNTIASGHTFSTPSAYA